MSAFRCKWIRRIRAPRAARVVHRLALDSAAWNQINLTRKPKLDKQINAQPLWRSELKNGILRIYLWFISNLIRFYNGKLLWKRRLQIWNSRSTVSLACYCGDRLLPSRYCLLDTLWLDIYSLRNSASGRMPAERAICKWCLEVSCQCSGTLIILRPTGSCGWPGVCNRANLPKQFETFSGFLHLLSSTEEVHLPRKTKEIAIIGVLILFRASWFGCSISRWNFTVFSVRNPNLGCRVPDKSPKAAS